MLRKNALDASHISKSYQSFRETVEVLQDVNLKMAKGEMVAVMGPSGSGTDFSGFSAVGEPDS